MLRMRRKDSNRLPTDSHAALPWAVLWAASCSRIRESPSNVLESTAAQRRRMATRPSRRLSLNIGAQLPVAHQTPTIVVVFR